MKGVEIRVKLGPYEAGSETIGAGGLIVEADVEEGSATDIQRLVREAVDGAIKGGAFGKAISEAG